jgi:pilus assembly protein Flp/PilA
MKSYAKKIQRFLGNEEGATAVEYAVMVALITALIIASVKSIGEKASTAFSTVDSKL